MNGKWTIGIVPKECKSFVIITDEEIAHSLHKKGMRYLFNGTLRDLLDEKLPGDTGIPIWIMYRPDVILTNPHNAYQEEICEAYRMAKSGKDNLAEAALALYNQVPKRIADIDSFQMNGITYRSARCPICRVRFDEDDSRWLSRYCPNCGQYLDWDINQ